MTQLAHFQVLADSGGIEAIPFVSRDRADAEQKALRSRVKSLSEALDDSVKTKDAKIAELQNESTS